MKIAVVTESFLPRTDGLSLSVRALVDRLVDGGHDPMVIAPGPGLRNHRGVPVVRTRSVAVPGTRGFTLGLPDPSVETALAAFHPDVVHVSSPVALGAGGLRVARRLGLPVVSDHGTDVSAHLRHHGLPAGSSLPRWVSRLHRMADRTLAPSRGAVGHLALHGVSAQLWRPGVDLDLFDPCLRSPALHDHWSRPGRADGPQVVVGYAGRLSAEKEVRRLAELADLPGTRLVVVGDGPERGWLERHVPSAKLTGHLTGRSLAEAVASLDVLVVPGATSTHAGAVHEAQAAGVPVVAADCAGTRDLVRPLLTGLLHDAGDPHSLRRATSRLVADPALRASLSAQGLTAARGRGWSAAVDELVAQHYLPVADLARNAA